MKKDHFAEKSRDWDARPVPLQISTAVGPLLRASLDWHAGMRIMDFGAGTGLLAAHVAPLVAKVIAVDTSP
jgi:2-polyprenyl-3-methyl-5-hydroxy-6-metoxy-1,4-benzoquinol methylase